jgi:hypothetical protein
MRATDSQVLYLKRLLSEAHSRRFVNRFTCFNPARLSERDISKDRASEAIESLKAAKARDWAPSDEDRMIKVELTSDEMAEVLSLLSSKAQTLQDQADELELAGAEQHPAAVARRERLWRLHAKLAKR